jgi:hypothetical protein
MDSFFISYLLFFHSCSNTVVFGRFIRFDSVQYSKFYLFSFDRFDTLQFDTICLFIYINIFFSLYSPWTFHSCYTTVVFGRFIRFDSIQYSKFYLFSFDRYNSIRSVYLFKFIYSFLLYSPWTFHFCYTTVVLGRFIRFDSIQYCKFYLFSFYSFRSIDTIRYDLFIYLN